MEVKPISEILENEEVKLYTLVTDAKRGVASNGKPYLSLVLQDSSGTLNAKLWDAENEDFEKLVKGEAIRVEGVITKYKGKFQLKIGNVTEGNEGSNKKGYEISKTVDKTYFLSDAPVDDKELKEEIYSYMGRIINPNIKKITMKLIEKYEDKYFTHPAAMRIHHEYKSGLAYHVKCMLQLADSIANVYPELNRDFLYAGIILHDFGKVIELEQAATNEYTKAGKLLGHISIGAAEISKAASELGIVDTEEVLILQHMVLSHHGKLEYGSPVLPMIKEAEVLSIIDQLDSRMAIMQKSTEDVKKGEFSDRIFGMESRFLYNPDID